MHIFSCLHNIKLVLYDLFTVPLYSMTCMCYNQPFDDFKENIYYTVWGIKISHISKGKCAGCSEGREVG